MAKLDAIMLPNGAQTPVTITFHPSSQIGTNSSLREITSTVPTAERTKLTLNLREVSKATPQKVSVKVAVPPTTAELLINSKADDVAVFISVVSTADATEARKKDAVAYARNLMGHAIFTDMVINGMAPY